MNKNIKKVAAVILATNVLASTVITTLPTGTHAAEQPSTNQNDPNSPLENFSLDTYFPGSQLTGTFPVKTIRDSTIPSALFSKAQVFTNAVQPDGSTVTHYIGTIQENGVFNSAPFSVDAAKLSTAVEITYYYSIFLDRDGAVLYTSNTKKLVFASPQEVLVAAQNSVNNLFVNGQVRADITQSDINAAQDKVNRVTDISKRAELQTELNKAQVVVNEKAAQSAKELAAKTAVDSLFINGKPKSDLTQANIDAAQAKINEVANATKKAEFQTELNKAQAAVNEKNSESTSEQAAKTAVDNLFIDGKPKTDLTQADIDAAQAKINDVADEAKKAELQAELDKAQAAINEKAAQSAAKAAIDSLSIGGKVKADVTQAEIDAAKAKINDVKDEAKKAELEAELKKATDVYTAIHAYKGLTFKDNYNVCLSLDLVAAFPYSYTVEIDGKYAGELAGDRAYYMSRIPGGVEVGGAKEGSKVDVVLRVNGVKYTIDSKVATLAFDKADKAVKELFIDNDTSKAIKPTLKQADLDAAQTKVTAVPDATQKAALQTNLDKATQAFNVIAPTTIGALTTESVTVTGKGEPNAPVTIKNGTTTIGTGTVKADGTFEVTIAKQAANATITASVTKASNGKIATASTVVTQGIDYSLSANAYKMGDTKLTGKVGKNVSKVRLWINGAVAVQGVINADGTYEFPTAANFIKLIGDKVEVVAVDSKFAEVNRTTVAVSGTSTFDNALTVAKFNTGDTKITGTIGKDISKVRLWVNDKVVAQAPTTTDGTYTFANADKFITSPLDKVEVVGVDAQYKEMNRKTVSLPGSDTYNNTFSVDNYFIGQNTLGGSYGQNTSKVRLWVNGVVVKQADLNPADNTFTLKGIFGLIKSKTDVAEIVYVDAQYKEIKRVAVLVK